MHKVWRALGLRQNRVEQLSIPHQELAIRRTRVVYGKHGMSDRMLELKEAEIKAEDLTTHMNHKQTASKNPKYKGEIPTGTVHARQIKKPQHYLYPHSKSGGRLHHRIMILDTLRGFYRVQRRHLLTLNNNRETRDMSKPFGKDVWNWTMA